MKEIATVVYPCGESEHFDNDVNYLISEGYKLTKRGILPIRNETERGWGEKAMLFAELERKDETL